MKRLLTVLVLTLTLLGPMASARAENESIGLSLEARPSAGPVYKEVYKPVDGSLTVTVTAPAGEPTLTPLKVANVRFPSEMGFFPNSKRTPVCGPDDLNEQSNLAAGVAATVRLCPLSVVGTGTALVQLARINLPQYTLTDPRLVIFNAGRNEAGRPKITIYGYSKSVNTGLLMHGVLAADGQLKINVGVLAVDSSVSQFTLGIPGKPIEVEDSSSESGRMTIRGRDPEYLRAKCSTGEWLATGTFVLGERAFPSGIPTGPETRLSSNQFSLPCRGQVGRPKLKIGKIKGPSRLPNGSRARFVVRISNTGTATARNLTLKASGAAKGVNHAGRLAPGATRKISLSVRRPKRGSSRKMTLRATARRAVPEKSVRKLLVG
jgi:hypothetical protein